MVNGEADAQGERLGVWARWVTQDAGDVLSCSKQIVAGWSAGCCNTRSDTQAQTLTLSMLARE